MNALLDPVWPWDRLWAVFLTMPGTDRTLAVFAALAAAVLPALLLVRPEWKRPLPLGLVFLLAWGGVLLARYGSLSEALPLMLLMYGPPALAGVAVGSYLGAPRGATTRVPRRRVFGVLVLRAAAFLMALLAIARPAFAWEERSEVRSVIWVALDDSRSMSILDEDGGVSRWARVQSALADARPLLTRLRDRAGIDVRFFRFGAQVGDFDPAKPGEPEGKATDVGGALRALMDLRDPGRPPRMLLLISDGADNGVAIPAQGEAGRWREAGCPITTFAVGRSNTTSRQNDVALTSITTTPQPAVPVRGKLTVKVSIDAHGYENSAAKLRLYIEAPDDKGVVAEREALSRDIRMPLRTGNEEEMTADAPPMPCEAKVRVTVETPEPDRFPLNNTIETFVTVSRDSASVLLVDRMRWEARWIHDALASEQRIRVTSVNVRGKGGTLALDGQPYDAIILGDMSADELRAIDKDAVEKIAKMVGQGTGLMMLGGHRNYNAGGWDRTPLGAILPAEQDTEVEQIKDAGQMEPHPENMRFARYLFDLKGEADPLAAWRGLAKLEGHTALKVKGANRTVLATAGKEKVPVLIMGDHGKARVLAFAGDTTSDWRNTEAGLPLFERFWRRVAVWLARQEDAEGGPWVRPDARRIPVRSDLGFQCGVRAKGGGEEPGAKIDAEVQAPGGTKVKVALSRGRDETRGLFQATQTPGVYRVVARSEGREASARVIVFDEDVELMRPAADPKFLADLARAGGGDALKVGELGAFLTRLAEQPVTSSETRRLTRPDWRTEEMSGFLASFLAVFCLVVCLEWTLRRWWGMV